MSRSPLCISPSLAWELIEGIIDYLQDEVTTLRRCALTCRNLRPRTRLHLLAHLRIDHNDHLEGLVDLLGAEPHLRSLVRSVAISLVDVVPLPLLILPNLSHWKFVADVTQRCYRRMTFHSSTLLCCQLFGTHVHKLSLDGVYFGNSMALVRILSAFPNIRLLFCRSMDVRSKGADGPLEIIKERLVSQARVTELSIGRDVDATAFGLILEVVHNTVQHLDIILSKPLVVTAHEAVIRAPQELKFPHLQYLILRLPRKRHSTLHAILRCTIGLLKNFSITVQEVTVEFSCYRGLHLLSSWLTKETNASLCKELESLMLRFALSAISFLSPQTIRASRREFWAGELGWYFPTLHRRGQIKILSKTIEGPDSHDAAVSVLAFSPDGKWIASGSADSTIILWDARSGSQLLAHEWVAHVGGVDRLAFSPSDGQFLASSGKDNAVTIWAVGAEDGVDVKCLIALREVERMWRVDLCGWVGDILLFTSRTKTKAVVRTWDTRTSTQRQLLAGGSVHVIAASQGDSSGFLVLSTRGDASIVRVRDIDEDMGVRQIAFLACDGRTSPPKDASCSSGGRLAIIYGDARVLVWDLETEDPEPARPPTAEVHYPAGKVQGIAVSPGGDQVLAWGGNSMIIWDFGPSNGGANTPPSISLEGHHDDRITTASFSPDGKLVASASKDGTIQLWSTIDGSCIAALTDHSGSVVCMAFSQDGKVLSSGDTNGTVVIRSLHDIVLEEPE